jgi:hypothetical protein
MLPNDPLLALRAAHDTMARRQDESSQERLAASARLAGTLNRARSHHDPAHELPRLIQSRIRALSLGWTFRRS